METLKELIALGNDGAPQAWLDSLTGQGIGEGMEGISAAEVECIIDSGELSAEADQAIQASYEMRSLCAHPSNYTAGRGGNAVQYIVIHYTAGATTADGAAEANCIYFSRNANLGASAHYFVCDGYAVWSSVPEGDTAWHAGNWAINQRSIGIEVCSAGAFTEAEVDRLAWLVQHLMGKHGIPASHVIRHFDANGKHCPAYYVDAARWKALHARITGSADGGVCNGSPEAKPEASAGHDVWLQARTTSGRVLPAVKNRSDDAGDGTPIGYLSAWSDPGKLQVQAYSEKMGWLSKLVNPSDIADLINGAVGDGSGMQKLRMYYFAPNADQAVFYRVMVAGKWLPWMKDHVDLGGSLDDFAGNGGAIQRVESFIGPF